MILFQLLWTLQEALLRCDRKRKSIFSNLFIFLVKTGVVININIIFFLGPRLKHLFQGTFRNPEANRLTGIYEIVMKKAQIGSPGKFKSNLNIQAFLKSRFLTLKNLWQIDAIFIIRLGSAKDLLK